MSKEQEPNLEPLFDVVVKVEALVRIGLTPDVPMGSLTIYQVSELVQSTNLLCATLRKQIRLLELESRAKSMYIRELEGYEEKRDAREALVHEDASLALRDALGPKLCNQLWGPELEALGRVVDVALVRAHTAEQKVEHTKKELRTLSAALDDSDDS